ncbi:SIS domain-containing protein [Deinococcus malanensis]
MPLLLAAPDADALPHAWQALLARVGKTLAIPVLGDPLPVVSSAFEAQHEKGDAKVAVLLGDPDPALLLTREILETRVDEVIHVAYLEGAASSYAAQLALWYFGAWVAAYLAERYNTDPADPAVLGLAQAVLSGEDSDRLNFNAGRDDLRRTDVVGGWQDDGEDAELEEVFDASDDDDLDDR